MCRELRSRANAELAVDLREVPRDRVRAEVELGGHLAVPAAGGDELHDLPLGFGERGVGGDAAADAPQLRAGPLQPHQRAELLEQLGRLSERLAGGSLVLRAALNRPER